MDTEREMLVLVRTETVQLVRDMQADWAGGHATMFDMLATAMARGVRLGMERAKAITREEVEEVLIERGIIEERDRKAAERTFGELIAERIQLEGELDDEE